MMMYLMGYLPADEDESALDKAKVSNGKVTGITKPWEED